MSPLTPSAMIAIFYGILIGGFTLFQFLKNNQGNFSIKNKFSKENLILITITLCSVYFAAGPLISMKSGYSINTTEAHQIKANDLKIVMDGSNPQVYRNINGTYEKLKLSYNNVVNLVSEGPTSVTLKSKDEVTYKTYVTYTPERILNFILGEPQPEMPKRTTFEKFANTYNIKNVQKDLRVTEITINLDDGKTVDTVTYE